MGTVCGRILWKNWALLQDTVLTVSSEQLPQAPKSFLLDPLRAKRWRTKLGWTIDGGFNAIIPFSEGGGTLFAFLTTDTYITGAELAAEIKIQLDAAGALTYTVTYSGITNKFTVSATGTFEFRWATGAPFTTRSVGEDIGFDITSDDTGSASYTADSASFGSRAWIKFDLGSSFASFPITSLIAFDGNFESGTVITVQANTSDSWATPALSQVLSMDSARDFIKGIAFITSTTTYRWWRFVIDDVQNTDGFIEMGVPYLGDDYEPSNGYSAAFTQDRSELTTFDVAEEGASFQHVKSTRLRYPLNWLGIPTAERFQFDDFAELMKVGRPYFMAFEPLTDPQNTLYVMLERPMKDVFQAPDHWRFNTDIIEVLQ